MCGDKRKNDISYCFCLPFFPGAGGGAFFIAPGAGGGAFFLAAGGAAGGPFFAAIGAAGGPFFLIPPGVGGGIVFSRLFTPRCDNLRIFSALDAGAAGGAFFLVPGGAGGPNVYNNYRNTIKKNFQNKCLVRSVR